MTIDWFTFSAQIINFLILLFLLSKFLYGPITQAMAERKERISEAEKRALQLQEKATTLMEDYLTQKKDLDNKKHEFLLEAEKEVTEYRNQLRETAEKEVQQKKILWEESMLASRKEFLQEVANQVLSFNHEMLKKSFQDLAGIELEDFIIQHFMKNFIDTVLKWDFDEIIIRSSYTIKTETIQKLEETITRLNSGDIRIVFEKNTDLTCGLEIIYGSTRVSWNFNHYLEELQKKLQKTLENNES